MSTEESDTNNNTYNSNCLTKCEECQNAEATLYCTTCFCFMCAKCDTKTHTESRVLCRHTRVKLGDSLRKDAVEEERTLSTVLERTVYARMEAEEHVRMRTVEAEAESKTFIEKRQHTDKVVT